MDRIEDELAEIKSYVDWFEDGWNRNKGAIDDMIAHNKRLLSLIDTQKKEIERLNEVVSTNKDNLAKVVNKMCGGTVPNYIFKDAREVYYSLQQALKQE